MARRLFSARTLVLGGLAVAAVGALKNRQKVSGLLGGGAGSPEPYQAPASAPVGTPAVQRDEPMPPPAVANADVAGPPENTATQVPAPEPVVHEPGGGIDEAAEEAAAAAEAANIGGSQPDYPSEDDSTRPIAEELRPLEESGEGYSEGQELAEADLLDNAEPAAGDPIEAERQIDEIIEAQDEPFSGETVEHAVPDPEPDPEPEATIPLPLEAPTGSPVENGPPPPSTSAEEKSAAVWKTDEPSLADQATVERPIVERRDDGA